MQNAMRLSRLMLVLPALLSLCMTRTAPADEDVALYWSVSRDGSPAGYLLGTIHSEDPRVLEFPEWFTEQLAGNRFFAMEMVPDLPTLSRLTEYMHYPDGTTLQSVIGSERLARVRAALSGYQVPPDWVSKMKVWAVMMTLSVPPPRTGLFMDFSLSLRAAGAGLKVVGLETLEEQLSFLEDMPIEQQLMLLDQALEEHPRVAEIHTQMVDNYLAGDLQALRGQVQEQLAELPADARDYFMTEGIEARNRRMLAALQPRLQEGLVFVAVGALHLPGDSGLIALLRQQGYRLTPLALPFSATKQGGQSEQRGKQEKANAP